MNHDTIKSTSRLEAFCDAVFAIAITLLVLELIQILHPVSDEGLIQTCLHHWQSFLAFAIGFITIMVCWINHHISFSYIRKVDTSFMWINGFLLFIVTMTPFPTAILAEYLSKEGAIALAFFGFNYFLIAIAADSICSYAYRHQLVDENLRDEFRNYKRIYRYGLFYTLLAFLVCFVSIPVAIFLYILLFTAFASPKRFAERISQRKNVQQNLP